MAAPSLVILPGLDGTGLLLQAFAARLRGSMEVQVIAYPTDAVMDYGQLATFVLPQLPRSQSFVLLGESFGGPLALSLALARPPALAGLVLAASFARFPIASARLLAPLLRFAPVRGVPPHLLSWLLLGRWSHPDLRAQLQAALVAVRPEVARARAAAALRIDLLAELAHLQVPLLCLRAKADRLIPASAADAIVAATSQACIVEIEAPHFLLQCAGEKCAEVLTSFVSRIR